MAQRKGSMLGIVGAPSGGSLLAPRSAFHKPGPPGAAVTSNNRTVSPEYMEAFKVLSDETMSQTCALMLSSQGGTTGGADGGASQSDALPTLEEAEAQHAQMLAIFGKCQKAALVIEREAVSLLLPSMPSSSSSSSSVPAARSAAAMASRTQAKALGSNNHNNNKGSSMLAPIANSSGLTKNSIPNRRMSRLPAPTPQPPLKRAGGALSRHTSDSSSQDAGSASRASGLGVSVKKPRLSTSPIPSSQQQPVQAAEPNAGGGGMEPPASVRNFLAKLNKDGSNNNNSKAPPMKKIKPAPEKSKPSPEKQKPPPPPEKSKPPPLEKIKRALEKLKAPSPTKKGKSSPTEEEEERASEDDDDEPSASDEEEEEEEASTREKEATVPETRTRMARPRRAAAAPKAPSPPTKSSPPKRVNPPRASRK